MTVIILYKRVEMQKKKRSLYKRENNFSPPVIVESKFDIFFVTIIITNIDDTIDFPTRFELYQI